MLRAPRKKTLIILALMTAVISAFVLFRIYKLYVLKLVTIDAQLREISGIEFDKYQRLWAINDGGDGAKLYHVQNDGSVKRIITITNAKNLDWEDMTQNDFGHFFIGDFGNNLEQRDWLTIYKIENPIDIKGDTTTAEIIKFAYPKGLDIDEDDQNINHDLEAFVYFGKQLYLFTKNRREPFDGKTHLFSVGDYAANHQAKYIDSFATCTSFKMSCWITSAAISPDRKKLVMLDSNRLWLFENWQGDNFFSGDTYKIDLGVMTQKESVTFFDNTRVVFTDEEFKGIGRNAYVVDLSTADKVKVSPQ